MAVANGQEDVLSELLQFSFAAALPKSGKEVRRKQKKARRKQKKAEESRRKQEGNRKRRTGRWRKMEEDGKKADFFGH